MPIEPDVGFAFFDEESKLIIHSKSIAIHLHQAMIAAGIGVDSDKLIKLGMDPFELRYKNVYRPGDTTPTGCEPDVYCMVDIMDKLKSAHSNT